ncbi:MAG: prephenate dehydratase [Chloroflexota bacterium]
MSNTQPISVAFQGEPGAYSEQAALNYFGPEARTQPCRAFDEIFRRVSSGEIQYGMIPIENSLAGSIHQNYDLLLRHQLHITGEYHLRVRHCLQALPGVALEEVQMVYSHPQALAQCEASLNRLGLPRKSEYDTAGSARLIAERGDRSAAAIASRRAAQVYGLNVLVENLEDDPANYTRFLALSCTPAAQAAAEGQEYKTSIVFSLDNHPGVLFKALSVFALRDLDMTKIESRPLPGKLWDYMFYIDFAGHTAQPRVQRALEHLAELATFLRVLGSYPRRHPDDDLK